jgi:hypothetical protein
MKEKPDAQAHRKIDEGGLIINQGHTKNSFENSFKANHYIPKIQGIFFANFLIKILKKC